MSVMGYFLGRCTIIFVIIAIALGISFTFIQGTISSRFDLIFHEKFTVYNPVCYDRHEFKNKLRKQVDTPNPSGIIFVSGAKNAGKTTAIKSALVGREHVVYLSLRDTTFRSEMDLVNHLKNSFHITQFKDHLKTYVGSVSLMLDVFSFFPKITHDDYSNLGEVLGDIRLILKHAKKDRSIIKTSNPIDKRPVIVIDEIGNFQGMVNGNAAQQGCIQKFLAWIVMISKDELLCDVIFASHDGFSLGALAVPDLTYTVSLMLPEFTEKELIMATESYPEELHGQFISRILSKVGHQGSHVIDSMRVSTKEHLELKMTSLMNNEREMLKLILDKGQSPYFYKTKGWDSFTKDEFHCIMKAFVKQKQKQKTTYPVINLRAMVEVERCDKNVIKYFSNQGWLLYDPSQRELYPRSKLFLDAYEFDSDAEADAKSLQWQILHEKQKRYQDNDLYHLSVNETLIKELEEKLSNIK